MRIKVSYNENSSICKTLSRQSLLTHDRKRCLAYSAGIKKFSHITRGNRYIKQALTMSGLIAAHSKDPAFSSFYNRISQRGSKMKAIIACAHKILRIIYKLLSTKQTYQKEKALGLRKQF